MSRNPADHGQAIDAIDYALDGLRDGREEFLRGWREGDLRAWAQYYDWLDGRRSSLRPAEVLLEELTEIGRLSRKYPELSDLADAVAAAVVVRARQLDRASKSDSQRSAEGED